MAAATEEKLSVSARLSRAVSFYSAAVPVFASYKLLDQSFKLRKSILNEDVPEQEIEEQFQQLHDWGSTKIADKIKELKGFYVKTGQIISTRVDIFPVQYTSKLSDTQDALDPLPAEIVKEVVRNELLGGADLSELFAEFDDVPLGSASIAQVHRAKLLDGRIVAVKVQRPAIGPKLLGDIANLKNFAKIVGDALPIDYYKIFCEIENTLVYELDFLHEAQATAKVAAAVAHSPNNKPRTAPVIVPLPIPGLVSTRVMVLEFIDGMALSKLAAEMTKRGVQPGSPESIMLGKKLLGSLTDAYSSMIFGSGIIHGDPHPGMVEGVGGVLLGCCWGVVELYCSVVVVVVVVVLVVVVGCLHVVVVVVCTSWLLLVANLDIPRPVSSPCPHREHLHHGGRRSVPARLRPSQATHHRPTTGSGRAHRHGQRMGARKQTRGERRAATAYQTVGRQSALVRGVI